MGSSVKGVGGEYGIQKDSIALTAKPLQAMPDGEGDENSQAIHTAVTSS